MTGYRAQPTPPGSQPQSPHRAPLTTPATVHCPQHLPTRRACRGERANTHTPGCTDHVARTTTVRRPGERRGLAAGPNPLPPPARCDDVDVPGVAITGCSRQDRHRAGSATASPKCERNPERLSGHGKFDRGTPAARHACRLRVPGLAIPAAGTREHRPDSGGEPHPEGAGDDARRTSDCTPTQRTHRAWPVRALGLVLVTAGCTTCRWSDSVSFSRHRSGTCSGHGGVAAFL